MDTLIANSSSVRRFNTLLLGAFALQAMLLAAIGIYGVISYGVAQRRREYGIRMALGAQPGQVLRLVLRRAVLLLGISTVLGLAAAAAGGSMIQSLLFNVRFWDVSTYLLIAFLLALVGLLASYVPARRATTVDPMVVLRSE
jgi:putative ABC transport system permease protein